jgi:hypothetical protein
VLIERDGYQPERGWRYHDAHAEPRSRGEKDFTTKNTKGTKEIPRAAGAQLFVVIFVIFAIFVK